MVKRALMVGVVVLVAAGMFRAGTGWHRAVYVAPYVENPLALAEDVEPPKPDFDGRFYPFRGAAPDAEALNALGYLSGYVEAPEASGVTMYDAARSDNGLNLYTSGHAPEAYLMSMAGEILHRWRYTFEELWPEEDATPNYTQYLRRTHLYDNGDLLSIFEPHGIFKLDKDSNLLWENHNGAHHDLHVHEDGSISVLTQKAHPVLWLTDYGTVIEDFITRLSPEGNLLDEVSLLECFANSRYASYLELMAPAGDVTHANALKFLDGGHEHLSPAFRRGNFLVSVRELDALVVVDVAAKQVVWALSGMWHRQHESTLLENGRMLLFDNLGIETMSQVIELDPLSQTIAWTYGGVAAEPLFSETCGSAARLANGNTLITESNNGRAFEVTPNKEVVWEYISPHRAGESAELIATLLDMVRLPREDRPKWLSIPSATAAN